MEPVELESRAKQEEEPCSIDATAADPERLVELTERLERIERKLSDLAEPQDGSHDRFRRWVDGGYWQHIRFSEFLRLKK